MIWREFTEGLAHVAQHGHTQGLEAHVVASLRGLAMITGSEADDSGVVLTGTGRSWYQRTTVNPENERLLRVYAEAIDRLFDETTLGD
ncbi:MAG TPA: hypothetical protein VN903_17685 [Polyangia bacterium]|nr:hypothetical protein [Polyangia bacterium]